MSSQESAPNESSDHPPCLAPYWAPCGCRYHEQRQQPYVGGHKWITPCMSWAWNEVSKVDEHVEWKVEE